jgi:hypothetical protein
MQMAAIYANSTLTIIAAEGENAAYGLLGLEGISKPRILVIQPRFPWYHMAQTPYFKRGWTFQEYLFSKRRLIFEGQMVRWECSRSAWSEDIVHSDGLESKFRCNWIDAVTYMYPSLDAFGSLGTCSSSTTIYNSRIKKIFCRHLLVSFPCSVKNTKVDSSAAYQRCISKAA